MSIKHCCFRNNHIGIKGSKVISDSLSLNKNLTSLDFSGNPLGMVGLMIILNNLKSSQSIKRLNLSNTLDMEYKINNEIADSIINNKSLKHLDLSDNNI